MGSNNIVYKNYEHIGFTNIIGDINHTQYKLLNTLIYLIQSSEKVTGERLNTLDVFSKTSEAVLTISFRKLLRLINWKSRNIKPAKTLFENLRSIQVSILLDSKKYNCFLFEDINVNLDIARIVISESVFNYLCCNRNKPFAEINLSDTNHILNNKYSSILHELCLFQLSNNKYEFELELTQLKELLNLPKDRLGGAFVYSKFKEFRRNVLQKSIDLLNKTAIIEYKIRIKCVGKPVNIIVFTLSPKTKEKAEIQKLRQTVFEKIEALGVRSIMNQFNSKLVHQLSYFELFYLNYCIELLEQKLTSILPKNYTRYLESIIKNNINKFKPIWIQAQYKLQKGKLEQIAITSLEKESIARKELFSYQEECVERYLCTLSDQKVSDVKNAFAEANKNNKKIKDLINANKWKSKLVYPAFIKFVSCKYSPPSFSIKELNKRIDNKLISS